MQAMNIHAQLVMLRLELNYMLPNANSSEPQSISYKRIPKSSVKKRRKKKR
jgi:hypothetical protein